MGFDIEFIPNVESVPREYFCPVCQLLICPSEALQAKCTHLYCKPCLAHVANTTKECPYDGCLVTETNAKPLVESNKMLAYTIGKTVVYCLYQRRGCTWLGRLADSSVHCSGCAFGSSIFICNGCGFETEPRQGNEYIPVCQGTQQVQVQESQNSQPIDASDQVQSPIQANDVVAVTFQMNAMLTQEHLYQQQNYRNNYGHYMHQQHCHMSNSQEQLHSPSQHDSQIASPHQTLYVEQSVQSVSQTQPQVQPNQINHVGVPVSPNSMLEYHQVGPPPSQVHNDLPQQISRIRPPLDTMSKPHPSAPSQLTKTEYIKQLVRKYGGASSSVSQESAMHPTSLSTLSLPQQHNMAQTTDVVHDQTQQGGHSTNPHIASRSLGKGLTLRPHEKHESASDLRPTPSTDFGEQQGLDSLVSKYTGMLDPRVLRSFRTRTNDFPMHLPKREAEGHGNSGKRLRDSDMVGPLGMPNNNVREDRSGHHDALLSLPKLKGIDFGSNSPGPEDIVAKYTRQGFPGDVGHFPDSRERTARAEAWCHYCPICKLDCESSQGLDFHFKSEEHHQKTIEVALMIKEEGKKLKTAQASSSSFRNWKNMEEGDSDS